jgi:hypothetical protein
MATVRVSEQRNDLEMASGDLRYARQVVEHLTACGEVRSVTRQFPRLIAGREHPIRLMQADEVVLVEPLAAPARVLVDDHDAVAFAQIFGCSIEAIEGCVAGADDAQFAVQSLAKGRLRVRRHLDLDVLTLSRESAVSPRREPA